MAQFSLKMSLRGGQTGQNMGNGIEFFWDEHFDDYSCSGSLIVYGKFDNFHHHVFPGYVH